MNIVLDFSKWLLEYASAHPGIEDPVQDPIALGVGKDHGAFPTWEVPVVVNPKDLKKRPRPKRYRSSSSSSESSSSSSS